MNINGVPGGAVELVSSWLSQRTAHPWIGACFLLPRDSDITTQVDALSFCKKPVSSLIVWSLEEGKTNKPDQKTWTEPIWGGWPGVLTPLEVWLSIFLPALCLFFLFPPPLQRLFLFYSSLLLPVSPPPPHNCLWLANGVLCVFRTPGRRRSSRTQWYSRRRVTKKRTNSHYLQRR